MIPKIIHQLWIGDKPPPIKMMNTWKEKNPDFQYILWGRETLRFFLSNTVILPDNINDIDAETFVCQKEIDLIREINGKADIMRWEILQRLGGIFIDADSICLEPLDHTLFLCETTDTKPSAFATFENEDRRKGLVATGTMGFTPQHPLCRDIVGWIQLEEAHILIRNVRAWASVGPALLTRFLNTGLYHDQITIFPSYMFLPIHFTSPDTMYLGHKKVYGYQEWGTAKNSYDTMDSVVLPRKLALSPSCQISVLVSSFNTKESHLRECLLSLKNQVGYFGIELVWINDGSTTQNTAILHKYLDDFIKTTRWTSLVYKENMENKGTRQSLHDGVILCSNEIIMKADSDDICLPKRFQTQIDYLKEHPECVMVGTNIVLFCEEGGELSPKKRFIKETAHLPIITLQDVEQNNKTWFSNHPTLCYRKSAILKVGNYLGFVNSSNLSPFGENMEKSMMEDYDLELRILREYEEIHNIRESLVYYRVHSGQLTQKYLAESNKMVEWRNRIKMGL